MKRPNRSIELWVIFIRRITFTHEDGSLLETLKKAELHRAILREIVQAWIIEGERTLFIGRP